MEERENTTLAAPRMRLAAWWNYGDFISAVFTNSPITEPMEVSICRLERAILHDKLGTTFSPMTVWYAYTHHPELQDTFENSKKAYNARLQQRKRVIRQSPRAKRIGRIIAAALGE